MNKPVANVQLEKYEINILLNGLNLAIKNDNLSKDAKSAYVSMYVKLDMLKDDLFRQE